MFKLTTSSGDSKMMEKPTYIRHHKNGCYLICDRAKAEGVAYAGIPYLFADGHILSEIDGGESMDALAALLSNSNLKPAALEMRKAIQFFIRSLTDEAEIMEIATMYPSYEVGKPYKVKDIFSYGTNASNDPQLYQVLLDHVSANEWMPDVTPSLYKAIGVTDDGYPNWVQPLGASDAYNTGDIVFHNGKLYQSTVDNNVWSPDNYGWIEYVE